VDCGGRQCLDAIGRGETVGVKATIVQRQKKGWLFWTPRVLCVLLAIFVSPLNLFYTPAGLGFWQTLVELFRYLLPSSVILIVLAIGWRWEWAGATGFFVLAALYALCDGDRFQWVSYLGVSGPLLLIAVLFFAGWSRKVRST
jgi:hypothetical protein